MELKIAFLHGLESSPISDKTAFLHKNFSSVYAPAIDYHNNPNAFSEILNHLKEHPVDLLIGSSMGGWFAYSLSTILGTPTLLFNPAFHSRPIEPTVTSGDIQIHHKLVLGINDKVIREADTVEYLHNNNINSLVFFENIGHRTPINIFEKYVNKIVNNFVK